jgi:acyl-CoA synthetase (AMP-forming)/AMP-acid ligase II
MEIGGLEVPEIRSGTVGPGYFVIAILGCADGGTACTPVTTLHTRYESAEQCSAATAEVLETNNNFDFPTLVARCRPGATASSAESRRARTLLASARRR